MEFNTNISDHNNLDINVWDLQSEDFGLPRESRFDAPKSFWTLSDQNEDSLMHMFGDQTPIRECGDLGFDNLELGDKVANNGLSYSRELSQSKRRRRLQFDSDADNTTAGNEQMHSQMLSSNENQSSVNWTESLQLDSHWNSDFLDDSYLFSNEVLDQAAEGWMESCFDENLAQCNIKDMSSSSSQNDIIEIVDSFDAQELCNVPPDVLKIMPKVPMSSELPKASAHFKDIDDIAPPAKTLVQRTPNFKIYKGTKTYIDSPTKITTTVAYPFAHIKPCELQGNLTLNDINQLVHAPPKSNHDDKSLLYPTSAFSGKPVVVKTKIRTDGGKGSITILRTKG